MEPLQLKIGPLAAALLTPRGLTAGVSTLGSADSTWKAAAIVASRARGRTVKRILFQRQDSRGSEGFGEFFV